MGENNYELRTNNYELNQTNSPKRHKILVTLTSMSDLKVKEKDRIKVGDIISDRTSDIQKLEAKKQQLEIAIAQLSLPLTQLAPLPEPNLESEKVALKRAQMELEMATKKVKYPALHSTNLHISLSPDNSQ